MSYYQSNEPYQKQADNQGFQWGVAAGAFASAAGFNFVQDELLSRGSKWVTENTKKGSKRHWVAQAYQDTWASSESGKLFDKNEGARRVVNATERAWTGKDGEWLKDGGRLKKYAGWVPNAVPGTRMGKVLGYGAIPLAGALFAGFAGETAGEAAANKAGETLAGKE